MCQRELLFSKIVCLLVSLIFVPVDLNCGEIAPFGGKEAMVNVGRIRFIAQNYDESEVKRALVMLTGGSDFGSALNDIPNYISYKNELGITFASDYSSLSDEEAKVEHLKNVFNVSNFSDEEITALLAYELGINRKKGQYIFSETENFSNWISEGKPTFKSSSCNNNYQGVLDKKIGNNVDDINIVTLRYYLKNLTGEKLLIARTRYLITKYLSTENNLIDYEEYEKMDIETRLQVIRTSLQLKKKNNANNIDRELANLLGAKKSLKKKGDKSRGKLLKFEKKDKFIEWYNTLYDVQIETPKEEKNSKKRRRISKVDNPPKKKKRIEERSKIA